MNLKTTLLAAAAFTIALADVSAHADVRRKAAFDVGLSMGIGRYQASVKQHGIAVRARRNAQSKMNLLTRLKAAHSVNITATTHQQFVDQHHTVRTAMRPYLRRYFDLGFWIGIAEGQASGSQKAAIPYAKAAVIKARALSRRLRIKRGETALVTATSFLNAGNIVTAYSKIVTARVAISLALKK